MCSVRQSPMPSAPNLIAVRASSGVSPLTRTPSLRTWSAQPISAPNSPDNSGSIIGIRPATRGPRRAGVGDDAAVLEGARADAHGAAAVIDPDAAAAGDAGLAHAAR